MIDVRHLPALANWRGRPVKVFAVWRNKRNQLVARVRTIDTSQYFSLFAKDLFPQGRLDCTLRAEDVAEVVPTPFRGAVQKLPSETKGEPIQPLSKDWQRVADMAWKAFGGDLAQTGEEMPRGPRMAKGAA